MVERLNYQSREVISEETLRLRRRCPRLALFAVFFWIAHFALFIAIDGSFRTEQLSTAAGLLPMIAGEVCAVLGVILGIRSRARGVPLEGSYMYGYIVCLLMAVFGAMSILMLLFFPRH